MFPAKQAKQEAQRMGIVGEYDERWRNVLTLMVSEQNQDEVLVAVSRYGSAVREVRWRARSNLGNSGYVPPAMLLQSIRW